MKFTKMHGAGNDYVYVDCFNHDTPADPAATAIAVSDRHKGIGADGLILIRPSEVADARMQMFNADGSEAEMCGNGVRCVAKYIYDHDICKQDSVKIETGAGTLSIDLVANDGKVEQAKVDMGEPILIADLIPTTLSGDAKMSPVVDVPLDIDGQTFDVTCVSMGNPHCVIFVDKATDELVHGIGPLIENDPRFPARVNVEFIELVSPSEVRQRTWERGSGETMACGTGASAVCVAGVLSGRTERKITNHLLGGTLILEWDETTNHVFKTGPAVEVFSGCWQEA
ncbi:diaminopimelate epimerase [Mariniblastus fucicola]|uniref:Diaminopimelate epimerase n=1 Tax=Mariniblastus fucicola TaxID=980251 RepID=A0A5B9PGA4_9BACT|nr:diaminopimelate epimerase [Mariniblastus fucicola]QEG23626.1 Diaminopimelate epimerase [Mariniblastus fucicola]